MKAEKEFSKQQLISFGNFLLRKERYLSFTNTKKNNVSKKERMQSVTDADFSNWKENTKL